MTPDNMQQIIDALNGGSYPDEIALLTEDNLKDLIEEDTGDGIGNYLLTRTLLMTLGSSFRKGLFIEVASGQRPGLNILRLISNATKPINKDEVIKFEEFSLKDYIIDVFGMPFIGDILFIKEYNSIDIIDKSILEWIDFHFVKKTARRPPWVTLEGYDNIKAVSCGNWKKTGKSEELYETNKERIDNAMYRITEVYDTFYGDEHVNRQEELDDIEEDVDFISQIMITPKRAMMFNEGMLDVSRVYGPLNSFVDSECDNEDCQLDGCRMLTCTCHLEEGKLEWFNSMCDECRHIIRDISYAVRVPEEFGGWSGCYCSVQCLTSRTVKQDRLDDLQSDLLYSGIMDRIKVSKI